MAKRANTYWDEIKNEETHFYGGKMGWEVHLRWEEWNQYDCNTGQHVTKRKLQLQWPWGYRGQEKLPKGEKKQARKDVLLQKKTRKLLAQASRNRNEYQDLNSRTSDLTDEDWQEIFDLKIKGFHLGDWIRRQHLTGGEAHSLFWRM